MNDVVNGNGSSFDIQGYDVTKCFDEMWYEDTMNDLWDVSVNNDKFALISKLDEKCKIVVKTPVGVTEMFELERIVLQGSVFGPIKCSVQMDTLGRKSLQTGVGVYKYRGAVHVPALAMIDDILGMASCGDDSIELNSLINSKIESKKLRLSQDKCFKIHICKTKKECTQILKVHEHSMKNVTQASYLGDILSENGAVDETILERNLKAIGIISQISSMLSSICLGSYHFEIAMVLREAKFTNSVLTNSEVWHNMQSKHIESLEKSDLALLRSILNAHSKTATEAFYLELGIYPLKYHLSKRRFMYLWHILHTDASELIRKVYDIQKSNPNKGDWVKMMEEEQGKYDLEISDTEISSMSRGKFENIVKKKIKTHAAQYLKNKGLNHSKSVEIASQKFQKKGYFSDRKMSRDDIQLLFKLRTKMLDCKTNFEGQFEDMSCRACKDINSVENEDHILYCSVLNTDNHEVRFSDVYGNTEIQYKALQVFKKILRKRKVYLEVQFPSC